MTSRSRWAEECLRYRFKDPQLLERALTHRSASKDNNERLEFLGDAFLSYSVARRLYERHPEASEGDLSRLRAALVKQPSLAAIGRNLDVESWVILGPGEIRSGGARRISILANTVEALIGAVLIDGGAEAAEALVARLFEDSFEKLPDAAELKDAKTRLQEWLQGRGLDLPVYRVEAVLGRAHEQTFTVVCEVREKGLRTSGYGPSRRQAEQEAAAAMLAVLTREQ